jgi:hypothetical protein
MLLKRATKDTLLFVPGQFNVIPVSTPGSDQGHSVIGISTSFNDVYSTAKVIDVNSAIGPHISTGVEI